jgi:phosphate transport system protein
MPMTRERFRQELDELSGLIQREATEVTGLLQTVIAAINRRDATRADATIAGDDRVDQIHIQVEHAVETLLAREAPVASDLRLILAVLHINLHLERMGDQCVNIAKLAKLTFDEAPLPIDLMVTFGQMGEQAEHMIAAAMRAFETRDLAQAESLVEMDQVINQANRDLVGRIMSLNGEASQEAGLRAILISRCLERIGDNAVDIGERTAYLVTAEFREFTDASHPV